MSYWDVIDVYKASETCKCGNMKSPTVVFPKNISSYNMLSVYKQSDGIIEYNFIKMKLLKIIISYKTGESEVVYTYLGEEDF